MSRWLVTSHYDIGPDNKADAIFYEEFESYKEAFKYQKRERIFHGRESNQIPRSAISEIPYGKSFDLVAALNAVELAGRVIGRTGPDIDFKPDTAFGRFLRGLKTNNLKISFS